MRIEKIDAATQRQVSDSLTLARSLGGVSMPYNGPTFEAAVAAFVAEYRINHIVVGGSMSLVSMSADAGSVAELQ